jgi:hypothetical protein
VPLQLYLREEDSSLPEGNEAQSAVR